MAEVTLKDTAADLDFTSRRISDTIRLAAAAFVVFVWGLLVAPPAQLAISARWLLAVGFFATATLVLDVAHYAAGFVCSRRLHRQLLALPEHRVEGYPRDFWYRARERLFWAKQATTLLAFLCLAAALLPAILARL